MTSRTLIAPLQLHMEAVPRAEDSSGNLHTKKPMNCWPVQPPSTWKHACIYWYCRYGAVNLIKQPHSNSFFAHSDHDFFGEARRSLVSRPLPAKHVLRVSDPDWRESKLSQTNLCKSSKSSHRLPVAKSCCIRCNSGITQFLGIRSSTLPDAFFPLPARISSESPLLWEQSPNMPAESMGIEI